jgi:two-component system response regulator HydG
MLDGFDVDVALCDVHMPEVGRVEPCQRLAESRPDLPVVLMTGVHAKERDQILEASGAQDCLPKPLRIERLVATLEDALAG